MNVIAILLEFIECLIHQLLHLRKLYSADLFERQRLYGIAVHRSRHPELNDYISTVVESLQVNILSSATPPPPARPGAHQAACPARHACCECIEQICIRHSTYTVLARCLLRFVDEHGYTGAADTRRAGACQTTDVPARQSVG